MDSPQLSHWEATLYTTRKATQAGPYLSLSQWDPLPGPARDTGCRKDSQEREGTYHEVTNGAVEDAVVIVAILTVTNKIFTG